MTAACPGNAPDVVDVVALGESMVTFLPSLLGRLAALDDSAWGRLRLGPGWTQAAAATEEVPAP